MSAKSGIAWTDATFNPWWGCEKVSEECFHCYAQRQATRYGNDCFGPNHARRHFGEKHWNEPLKWARKASKEGRKWRVFCASMGDVFEDNPALDEDRARLWALIELTHLALDWLLLTKRPNNMARILPPRIAPMVWAGSTVGLNRHRERLDALVAIPSPVHFVSCEPLLEDLNLRPWLPRLQWVIAGGESGPLFRECKPEWVRSLRDQCLEAGVPFFFKQFSSLRPEHLPPLDGVVHDAMPEVRHG
jgi:protein gp37